MEYIGQLVVWDERPKWAHRPQHEQVQRRDCADELVTSYLLLVIKCNLLRGAMLVKKCNLLRGAMLVIKCNLLRGGNCRGGTSSGPLTFLKTSLSGKFSRPYIFH
jgi:hypothetical protein